MNVDSWAIWTAICEEVASKLHEKNPDRIRLLNYEYLPKLIDKYKSDLDKPFFIGEFKVTRIYQSIMPVLKITLDYYGKEIELNIDFRKNPFREHRLIREIECKGKYENHNYHEFYWEEGGGGLDSGKSHYAHICKYCYMDKKVEDKKRLKQVKSSMSFKVTLGILLGIGIFLSMWW